MVEGEDEDEDEVEVEVSELDGHGLNWGDGG